MLQPQAPPPFPDGSVPTVTIVEVGKEPTPGLSMIDVAVAAFGLTGVIMAAAVVAGITAGILYIWYRSRRAITVIEARGGQHDLFKA
ncbi:MAG: hypothetical protein AB7Q16_11240 [Vicinamibacterales bacterium]